MVINGKISASVIMLSIHPGANMYQKALSMQYQITCMEMNHRLHCPISEGNIWYTDIVRAPFLSLLIEIEEEKNTLLQFCPRKTEL
jgi:hypothetical protein